MFGNDNEEGGKVDELVEVIAQYQTTRIRGIIPALSTNYKR